jgi:AcrR family transcriptional regulator
MSRPDPPTANQVRGARSREEILDAAERLMGARGYAATSISTLAKESGLPASSIYWHFGSKSGVLGAVMERGAQRFFATATPIQLDDRAAPRERLGRLLDQSTAAMRQHSQFLRLFIVLLLGAEGEHAQQEVITRVRAEAHRLLRLGLTWAYLPWGDEIAHRIGDQVGDLALALFDGLFMAAEVSGGQPPAELVDQAVAALHALAEQLRASG